MNRTRQGNRWWRQTACILASVVGLTAQGLFSSSPGIAEPGSRDALAVIAHQADPSRTLVDLSGKWEIQEEDKTYWAILDRSGNGTYSWQEGTLLTTQVSGDRWEGTWYQPGNDREGGFEVVLSEDHAGAQGVWWYTRVGERRNIPPRQWGGSYFFRRAPDGSGVTPGSFDR